MKMISWTCRFCTLFCTVTRRRPSFRTPWRFIVNYNNLIWLQGIFSDLFRLGYYCLPKTAGQNRLLVLFPEASRLLAKCKDNFRRMGMSHDPGQQYRLPPETGPK